MSLHDLLSVVLLNTNPCRNPSPTHMHITVFSMFLCTWTIHLPLIEESGAIESVPLTLKNIVTILLEEGIVVDFHMLHTLVEVMGAKGKLFIQVRFTVKHNCRIHPCLLCFTL